MPRLTLRAARAALALVLGPALGPALGAAAPLPTPAAALGFEPGRAPR